MGSIVQSHDEPAECKNKCGSDLQVSLKVDPTTSLSPFARDVVLGWQGCTVGETIHLLADIVISGERRGDELAVLCPPG
jgi:hypothetical protein